ncbi:MAG: phage major capsid protein [Rhodospirillales bacterium]|nr:phage major capsid protein [Rhodospirillales bacterium]
MTIRQILARREEIRTELAAINAAHPDGTLAGDAEQRWNALAAEAEALSAREQRQALVDELDRRAAGNVITTGSGDARFEAEVRQFSIVRAIAAASGLNVDAGREREVSAELARRSGRTFQGVAVPMAVFEQRVLTTGKPAGGPGSNIIGTDYRPDQFVDRLRAALVVRRMGARYLSGLVGNVEIPRQKASVTSGWVAENSALTASDPQFDQVGLTPKHAGCITEFSRNMLLQSSPAIEELIRADMSAVLAQTLDNAAISGTGSSNQPRGVLNTSGIGSVAIGTNGGALTYDSVVDLMGQLQDANADSSPAFLTNPKVRRAALKLKDSQGRPLGEDVVFQGQPRAFTTNVPSNGTKGTGTGLSSLIYGNWNDLLIGVWSELDILVNPYESTAYTKGNVQIRAMLTCDVAVRHPESFAAITDIVA